MLVANCHAAQARLLSVPLCCVLAEGAVAVVHATAGLTLRAAALEADSRPIARLISIDLLGVQVPCADSVALAVTINGAMPRCDCEHLGRENRVSDSELFYRRSF